MIISHKRKFIYIRLKKVGGSSLQKAIKELLRDEGLAKNYKKLIAKKFRNTHITARELQSLLPEEIWNSYLKVATIRCPYDMLVSSYYWASLTRKELKPFEQFISEDNRGPLMKICRLHSEEGKLLTDFLIRHEHLAEDIGELEGKIDCPGLLKIFQGIREKGGTRPKTGASSHEMYSNYPNVKRIIDEECRKWADKKYEFFETYWPAYKAKLEQEMSEYNKSLSIIERVYNWVK